MALAPLRSLRTGGGGGLPKHLSMLDWSASRNLAPEDVSFWAILHTMAALDSRVIRTYILPMCQWSIFNGLSLAVSRHEGWSTTTQRFSPDLEIDAARRRLDAPIGISRMNAGSD